jgi:hypothetical protein
MGKSRRRASSAWLAAIIALGLTGSRIPVIQAAGINPSVGEAAQAGALRIDTSVHGQTRAAYFLDQMPDNMSSLDLPASAHEIVVAKVRLHGAPIYIGGRDISGEPAKNISPDILLARVEIIEIKSGQANLGEPVDVRFGRRGATRDFAYPYRPEQLGRHYFAVIYLDAADGVRRVAASDISELQYSRWEAERFAYTVMRGKSGFRQ